MLISLLMSSIDVDKSIMSSLDVDKYIRSGLDVDKSINVRSRC